MSEGFKPETGWGNRSTQDWTIHKCAKVCGVEDMAVPLASLPVTSIVGYLTFPHAIKIHCILTLLDHLIWMLNAQLVLVC
jgi:hypothetical protein